MTYVLDGRRVAVRDLLDAGLVSVGDTLTFDRPRVGQRHAAVIEKGGSLRVDGRSYATPSRAAATAAGLPAVDGWTAWVTEGGLTLRQLRASLLDEIAGAEREAEVTADRGRAAAPHQDDGDESASAASLLSRHDFLKKAREMAERDEPLVVSVRALLNQWGVSAREHRVSRHIEADLDNHGLATRPNFLKVALDDDVALVAVQSDLVVSASQTDVETPPEVLDVGPVPAAEQTAASQQEIGLTLGNLTSSARTVVSVKATSTFAEAMTLMLINDYSQLPVLQGKRKCLGAVTWRSIAYAQLKDPAAPFSAAIVPVTVEPYDRDLHHMLPVIQAEDFVVVTDDHNVVSGIVTTADVVGLYGERTLPFLLIGELDQELRQIMTTIDFELVRHVCSSHGGAGLTSVDDMTMGQYQHVLANPECWASVGWPLDRVAFVARLDELRRIRNDVMHFNPDGVPDGTIEDLRRMLALIRAFGPATVG